MPLPGLQLGSLTAEQRAAALHLLQALLSPKGYRKVLDIMGSDQALSERGQPFASGEHHLAAFRRGEVHMMSGFREHQEGPRHLLGEEADRKTLQLGRVGDDGQDTARLAVRSNAGFDCQVRCGHTSFLWVGVGRCVVAP
ncbi:DUF3500 domain-containing protein [Chelatococcus asaccharovorans]|uniref:DUF3500 domain-containing protein n=1 Tax=Chelatococcus asaccharovorans TaxID=28210 RepID=UPI003976AFB9